MPIGGLCWLSILYIMVCKLTLKRWCIHCTGYADSGQVKGEQRLGVDPHSGRAEAPSPKGCAQRAASPCA